MAGRRRRRPCLSRQRRRVRSRTDTATTRRPAPRRAGQGRGRWPPARRWLGLALPDVSDWDTPSACSVHGIVHETRCDAPGGARHPRARQDTGPGISRGHQRSQRLTGTPETGVAVLITQRSQVQSCPRYHCPRYQVVAGQEPDRRETVRLLTCMAAWWQQDRAVPAGRRRGDWQGTAPLAEARRGGQLVWPEEVITAGALWTRVRSVMTTTIETSAPDKALRALKFVRDGPQASAVWLPRHRAAARLEQLGFALLMQHRFQFADRGLDGGVCAVD